MSHDDMLAQRVGLVTSRVTGLLMGGAHTEFAVWPQQMGICGRTHVSTDRRPLIGKIRKLKVVKLVNRL